MKTNIILSMLALAVMSAYSSPDTAMNNRVILALTIKAFETYKARIIESERLIAEKEHGKEKATLYIRSFEEGMKADFAPLTTAHTDNDWLEAAFWRGYNHKVSFFMGFESGYQKRKDEPKK